MVFSKNLKNPSLEPLKRKKNRSFIIQLFHIMGEFCTCYWANLFLCKLWWNVKNLESSDGKTLSGQAIVEKKWFPCRGAPYSSAFGVTDPEGAWSVYCLNSGRRFSMGRDEAIGIGINRSKRETFFVDFCWIKSNIWIFWIETRQWWIVVLSLTGDWQFV